MLVSETVKVALCEAQLVADGDSDDEEVRHDDTHPLSVGEEVEERDPDAEKVAETVAELVLVWERVLEEHSEGLLDAVTVDDAELQAVAVWQWLVDPVGCGEWDMTGDAELDGHTVAVLDGEIVAELQCVGLDDTDAVAEKDPECVAEVQKLAVPDAVRLLDEEAEKEVEWLSV